MKSHNYNMMWNDMAMEASLLTTNYYPSDSLKLCSVTCCYLTSQVASLDEM